MKTLTLDTIADAAQHARAAACPGCGRHGTLSAFTVRKDGPNRGRLFMTCGGCGQFVWLSGGGAAPRPRPAPEETPAGTQAESEEAGLIDDIASDPADDAPRLIYADWLEERGHDARAEFLRVGVRRDRLSPDEAEWKPLDDRHRELLASHGEFWFGTAMRRAAKWSVAGGLVEAVELSFADFVAHADALLRDAPAAEWRVGFSTWSELRVLMSCPAFARVRRLRLDGCHLGGDGVRILASCPRASGLRGLSLAHHDLGLPGVRALTMSIHLEGLRDLDLSDNNLPGSAAAVLASTAFLPRLRRLSLAGNLLGDADVRALVNSRHLKELRSLDLSGNALTSEAADALAGSSLLAGLRSLDLSNTGVGSAGAYRLRHSPHARPDLAFRYGERR